MDEGFVRDHPGKSEADVRMARIIVIPTVEVLIIFDRKDLLEKDEPIQDRGTDPACDRDNGLHPIWKIRCERQRGKSANRGPSYGVEALDSEAIGG